jgi:hypothetical protein
MKVGDLVVFDLEVYNPPTHLEERVRRAVMILMKLPSKGSKLRIGHVYDGTDVFPTFMDYLRSASE